MAGNLGDDLKKLMFAGVGAVVAATEKSKEWIEEMAKKGEDTTQQSKNVLDDLAQKGESAFEQGKVLNEELKAKVQKIFERAKDEAKQLDLEEMANSLSGMTDDALNTLRSKLDELIERRANQPMEESAPEGENSEEQPQNSGEEHNNSDQ